MDVHAIRAQNNDKHVRLAGNANDAMTAAAAGPLAEGQGHGGVKGHPQTEMKERDERERERTITHTHTHRWSLEAVACLGSAPSEEEKPNVQEGPEINLEQRIKLKGKTSVITDGWRSVGMVKEGRNN